jgi:hypothetical protein
MSYRERMGEITVPPPTCKTQPESHAVAPCRWDFRIKPMHGVGQTAGYGRLLVLACTPVSNYPWVGSGFSLRRRRDDGRSDRTLGGLVWHAD